jgi:PAS domain S-box-containing protein
MKPKWSWQRCQPVIVEYLAAVLFVAAAAIVTVELRKLFPAIPSSFFFCAVILSAWRGGLGPGLLASILSSTIIIFWLPPPSLTSPNAGSEIPRFLAFLMASYFISWSCNQQRRAQAALRQARDELEQRVDERTKELTAANEGLRTEIAGRKRTEALLDGQKRVLEIIATGAPLSESLDALMHLIEAHVPGMLGSILLLDEQGVHLRHGAAPSLPPEYLAAIDGTAIGPSVGSCGTAAYRKEAVIVQDIATDPLWQDHRGAALPHGLRACWSMPIFDTQRRVLGTFAMYYRQPVLPQPEHLRLIEMVTHIAAIAICRHHSQAALQESEAKLKEAQRIANIGYWERDLTADRITWSEGASRIFGLPPQNYTLHEAQLQKMIHPADRQLRNQALADALHGGPLYDVEFRIVRPGGEIRFVHVRDEIEYDALHKPIRMFGTAQDITERKLAEESLRRMSRQNEMILNTAGEGIWGLDAAGNATFINPAGTCMLGYEPQELIGRNMHAILHYNTADGLPHAIEQCLIYKALRDGLVHRCSEDVFWRKDGTSIPVQYVCNPMIENGKVIGEVVVFSDITERKQAEARLLAQEQEIRAIVENSPDPIIRFDRELRRTYVNPASIKANEVPREALLGRKVGSAVEDGAVNATKEEVEIFHRSLKHVFDTSRPLDFETTWPRPAGRRSYVVHLEPEFDASGVLTSVLSIARDITDRKRAEEAVLESQQLLHLVLATLPVGVAVTDRAGDIVLNNEAAKRIWGKTVVSGSERWAQSKGFWHGSGERIAPENWASARALSGGQTSLNELIDIEAHDGQKKIIQNSAAPIRNAEGLIVGAVIVNEDVTERVRAEETLRQTQVELARVARLTMMGELTASIAHEVNQPLAAVVTNAYAASRWLAAVPPNLDEAREAVRRIARDGNRASEVIKRIRALIKKSEPARTSLSLNELIRETVALTQPELTRKKVSLQTELAPGLPRVPADRVQLQQVMLNLVVNALDSMSAVADHPRVLDIRTDRPEADVVHVAVQDTGVGIAPEETERLFQPFYTTKPDGLGMGLAISRSIVEAHGGRLWATPNDGRGATFEFTLPVQDGGGS